MVAALLVVLAVPISGTDADVGPPALTVESATEEPASTTPVRLRFGDDERLVETRAATVGSLLIEQGIVVQPGDTVDPASTTAIRQDMVINLRLVRDVIVHEEEPILYRSELRYDYTIPLGQKVVLQAGAIGTSRRTYEVRTVNDNEESRTLIGEETVAPINQIVLVGLNTESPLAPPGEGQCRSNMAVWATYYTAVSAGGTVTRTGTGVFRGIVATDPSVIPLGTRMYVPGYGYGVAADTGGGVIGAHIDLAYGANDVYDWGARHVEICVLD
ncbi:MAG: G5 domain-containing protein [Chloroflexi bacterium]|nr:G5 domain-containing protein [Chloroflexota bacterium]